jgi:hypothetical protein
LSHQVGGGCNLGWWRCWGTWSWVDLVVLAWILSLHPFILACLSSITSYLKKWVQNWPLHHQEDLNMHKVVIKQQTICMRERLTTNIVVLLDAVMDASCGVKGLNNPPMQREKQL